MYRRFTVYVFTSLLMIPKIQLSRRPVEPDRSDRNCSRNDPIMCYSEIIRVQVPTPTPTPTPTASCVQSPITIVCLREDIPIDNGQSKGCQISQHVYRAQARKGTLGYPILSHGLCAPIRFLTLPPPPKRRGRGPTLGPAAQAGACQLLPGRDGRDKEIKPTGSRVRR